MSLMYGYNSQIHHTAGTAPFDIILSNGPPSASTYGRLTKSFSDIPGDMQSQDTNQRLPDGVERVRAAVRQSIAATQKIKDDYDKKIRWDRHVRVSVEVYMNGPKHAALVSHSTKKLLIRRKTNSWYVCGDCERK